MITRIELITSKEYWAEHLETSKENNHTDYEISMFIVDKIKEVIKLSKN
jgi:hypothetical protein